MFVRYVLCAVVLVLLAGVPVQPQPMPQKKPLVFVVSSGKESPQNIELERGIYEREAEALGRIYGTDILYATIPVVDNDAVANVCQEHGASGILAIRTVLGVFVNVRTALAAHDARITLQLLDCSGRVLARATKSGATPPYVSRGKAGVPELLRRLVYQLSDDAVSELATRSKR